MDNVALDDVAKASSTPPESNLYESMDEAINTSFCAIKEETATKKKASRLQQKRLVGAPSKTINQMKDVTVKQVAASAVTAVCNLQRMTVYDTETKALNNPKCDTLLINYDECVQVPRAAGDGEKVREVPKWTILAPEGSTPCAVGAMLQAIGQAMLDEGEQNKQRITINSKKGKKPLPKKRNQGVLFELTDSANAFLNSLYGDDSELAKKKRFKNKSA